MNNEELEERIGDLEKKVSSKIGWGELICAFLGAGIIVGIMIYK